MFAFFDAQCPKCKRKFGWSGKVSSRPPCPKCGHELPKKELEKAESEIEKALEKNLLDDDDFVEELRGILKKRNEKREHEAAKTPVGEKVEYVKKQGQDRPHHCHWPNCGEDVPPAMWGCRKHWFKLPKRLRDKIWATYRPGQEKTMTPSDAYLEVVQEVQEWIEEHGGN